MIYSFTAFTNDTIVDFGSEYCVENDVDASMVAFSNSMSVKDCVCNLCEEMCSDCDLSHLNMKSNCTHVCWNKLTGADNDTNVFFFNQSDQLQSSFRTYLASHKVIVGKSSNRPNNMILI